MHKLMGFQEVWDFEEKWDIDTMKREDPAADLRTAKNTSD